MIRYLKGKLIDLSKITPDLFFLFIVNLFCLMTSRKLKFSRNNKFWICSDYNFNYDIKFLHKSRLFLYINGIQHRLNILSQQYLLSNINFNKNDVIIDCGANIGELGIFFKINYPNVDYYSFEPSKKEFECLKENLSDFGVHHNVALWNKKEILNFFIDSPSADSSLIEPMKYSETDSVQGLRLDSFDFKKIRLLKLEAEGAEPEIIEGSKGIINMTDIVTADLGFERGKNSESTIAPVSKFLTKNNFFISEIYPQRLIVKFEKNNL